MKCYHLKILLISILLVIAENSHATELKDLYEAQVFMDNQQAAETDNHTYAQKAFAQVLIKVSGSLTIPSLRLKNGQLVVSRAEDFMQQFSIRNLDESISTNMGQSAIHSNIQVHKVQQTSSDNTQSQNIQTTNTELTTQKKVFWARFDQQGVDQLLLANHLPVWGRLRPDTLVWLSVEQQGKRELYTAQSEFAWPLLQRATYRGIVLIFPYVDIEDRNKLSLLDLWGNYAQTIKAASTRYNTEAIITIRVYQAPSGQWVGNQSLYVLNKAWHWKFTDKSLPNLLQRVIDRLTDDLADVYAPKTDDDSTDQILIKVNNIVSYQAFRKLNQYFEHLSAVKQFQLQSLQADTAVYQIESRADRAYLLKSIALGEVLQKIEQTRETTAMQQDGDYVAVILDDKPDSQSTPNTAISKASADNAIQETSAAILDQDKTGNAVQAITHYDAEYWLAN